MAMRTSTGEAATRASQRVERQPRVAEAERAVLGVARVVEEERRALAVARARRRPALGLRERGEQIAGAAVEDQLRVLGPHAAEAGEDVVDLAASARA